MKILSGAASKGWFRLPNARNSQNYDLFIYLHNAQMGTHQHTINCFKLTDNCFTNVLLLQGCVSVFGKKYELW